MVIWSDKSKFNLFGSDGRVYIRRRIGEDFHPDCIQQTVKFGGGNVMMWGCVSCEGVGPLVRVEGKLNGDGYLQLLCGHLQPYAQALGPDFIFMDDNAPMPSSTQSTNLDDATTDHLYGGVATSKSGFESN